VRTTRLWRTPTAIFEELSGLQGTTPPSKLPAHLEAPILYELVGDNSCAFLNKQAAGRWH
jgi:hypothetical protein